MGHRETPYFKEKVHPIEVREKRISELLKEMSQTGFQGRKLGEVVEVWLDMLRQPDLVIVMGLAGSMSTTGMWKIICWLIERRYIDILIPTGANISEDLYEALGGSYWKGTWLVDDEDLLKHKIDRFYDVYADELEYRRMEETIAQFMQTLDQDRVYSSREFLQLFGKWLSERGVECIVSKAYKHGVPIYCPALVDSGYGVAAISCMKKQHLIRIDQMEDFRELTRLCAKRKTGAIYIGGGVPKDFCQLAAVTRDLLLGWKEPIPHEYAIQITTDAPHWGGLSGCTLEEAISWGKVSARGKRVTCYCDATIALPLVAHALLERVDFERRPPQFDF